MKWLLLIAIFFAGISCESLLNKERENKKNENHQYITQKFENLSIKLVSPKDTSNYRKTSLYDSIAFLINDTVPLFGYNTNQKNIVGYQDKVCEVYNDFYIFKINDTPNPNKYLVFQKENDKIRYYGTTQNVTGEIFGDIDYDSKIEIGGYNTYQRDTTTSVGKFINNNFRVYELGDSIRRDQNIERKFHITIDSTQLAEIKNKVFDLGISLFEIDCSVGCECDCGSGSIVFLDDNKFIENFYCMPDMDYYTGTYAYRNNKISLTYKSRSLIYTPLNEETFNQYELKVDTILTTKQDFDLMVCNDSVIIFKGKESYLKESLNMKFEDIVTQYKNNDVWNMLEIDGPYKEDKQQE